MHSEVVEEEVQYDNLKKKIEIDSCSIPHIESNESIINLFEWIRIIDRVKSQKIVRVCALGINRRRLHPHSIRIGVGSGERLLAKAQ